MSQRTNDYNYTGSPSVEALTPEGLTAYKLTGHQPLATRANISTSTQVDTQEKLMVNGMEFVSIKNETKRYYDVPVSNKTGTTVRVTINKPQWLFVRSSGAHMVIDSEGGTHYIPSSFVHLVWFKKEGTEAAEF